MADVEVKYKGSTIGQLSATGSLMLETAGKYCEGDIGVYYVDPGGGGSGGNIYQDAEGYLVLDEEAATGGITVVPLQVSANGTYTAAFGSAYSPVTVNVSGGGAAASDAVRFIDYDGTVLYTYSASEFLALSTMPTNPTHSGLTAQGWNWSLSDAQSFVTDWEYLDIGQSYVTSSGDTEIDVSYPSGYVRLDPYLSITINGTVEIDWGDGSTKTTATGTSLSTEQKIQHTYSTTGNYTIKIHVVSGSFAIYHSTSTLLLCGSTTTLNNNRCYASRIQAIRLGTNVSCSNNAFRYCTSLQYITIPSTLTSVGNMSYCYSLKCLILPSALTNFPDCNSSYSLKYISFPKGSYNISNTALQNLNAIKRLIIPTTGTTGPTQFGSNNVRPWSLRVYIVSKIKYKMVNPTSYDFNSTLSGTSIPASGYTDIRELDSITIPNTITTIGASAFRECTGLTSCTLPNAITMIPQYIFYNCVSLESISIPSTVTNIDTSAFAYCRSLRNLVIPSATNTISNYLCYYCSSLQSITYNSTNFTNLQGYSFNYCESLPAITIPSTVTNIGSQAFAYCYSLTSLTIPASVATIGTYAFNNCYGMKEYHFKSTNPPTITNINVFSNIPSDCIIYVPSASLNTYKTADYWSTYASYMVGE